MDDIGFEVFARIKGRTLNNQPTIESNNLDINSSSDIKNNFFSSSLRARRRGYVVFTRFGFCRFWCCMENNRASPGLALISNGNGGKHEREKGVQLLFCF